MRLNFHENHRVLFGTVFVVFLLLTLIIAVGPAWWVQVNNQPLPGSAPLTETERTGMEIYVSEGCAYCHTQQVRPLAQDTFRYGRASAPGDYARLGPRGIWRQTPSILGTERTGPDLSNIGERQPGATWHHIHLYQPRALVEGSVMPAFPWLYEVTVRPDSEDVVVPVPAAYAPTNGQVVATDEAKALVAYLLALRQARMSDASSPTTWPADRGAPEGQAIGARVYTNRCASCHQPGGGGVEGVYPPLAGDPVVTAEDPTRHIQIILFGLRQESIDGVAYPAAMPAWGDQLTDEQIAGVVNHERTNWGNDAPTVTAEDVADIRKEGQPDDL